LGREKPK
jgi:hypothetical protein